MAQAICGLDSVSRWAVSGTPVQNRLSDFATLLRFIRVYPYNDPKRFDADISRPWKSGEDEEAVKRLKRLSASLLLRRPKGTVNVPSRRDTQCPVDFSRDERILYDKIRDKTIAIVDNFQGNSEASGASTYVNVLQQIESLRLVCNLGLYYRTRHDKLSQSSVQAASDWTKVAQHTFNVQREMGPIIRRQCSTVLELVETLFDDSTSIQHLPQYCRCLKFVCSDCTHKLIQAGCAITCGHSPQCPVAPVSLSSSVLEEVPDLIFARTKMPVLSLPSKVEALVADLKSLNPGVKW